MHELITIKGVGTDLYQRRTNVPTSGDVNVVLAYPLVGRTVNNKDVATTGHGKVIIVDGLRILKLYIMYLKHK